ncbi:MAG: PAS domain S-box protein [Prolixibacteraceae bacterium]|jgi:PAS domain S-box-containing protein|nr:PAS domain S-box protein [Prolixibacteraceae bacterium]
MFVELVYNAALLVTLSVFYGALSRFRTGDNFLYKIFVGLLFGFIAVAGMNIPVYYAEGIIYDGRSVILALAGLFGGGIASIFSILVAGTYRALIGGAGVVAGVATIIVCGLTGVFFRRIYKNKPEQISLFMLWVIGIAAHILMLISQLLLPWDKATDVIRNIWVPVLLVFPLATLLIGIMLRAEEKRIIAYATIEQSKRLFQALSENSPAGIFRADADGKIIYINNWICNLTGISLQDTVGNNWLNLVHPDDREWLHKKFTNAIKAGRNFHSEFRISNKNGNLIIVSAEAVPEPGENGKINGFVGTVTDITEQKRYQEALIQSEQNFREGLDESPLGIRITDSEGNTVYVNRALLDIFGGTAEEFIKLRFSSVYTPESYELHKMRKEKREKGEEVPMEYEISIVNCKGETRQLHVYRKEIVWDGSLHFQSLYSDITEKKAAEQALREREDSLREAERIGQMGHWENNMLTNKGKWSENCYRIFGHKPFEFEINFDYFLSRVYPEDIQLVKQGYAEILTNRQPIEQQVRIILPDGSLKWMLNKIEPVFSGDELVLLKGAIMDITKLRLAEDKLKLLNKSIEQTPISIVVTDAKGKIEYINPEFSKITGYSEEEAIGNRMNMLSSGTHSREFYDNMWGTILAGKDWIGEVQNRKKNGELYWESLIISPVFDTSGLITNFVGVIEDITEYKKMIEEITLAKEKAEEGERLKSAFLANMSHEIRTPLNAILGFTQMLISEDDLPEEQKNEFTSIVNRSSENLLQIINDILAISQLETNQLQIFKKQFNVNDMLSQIYSQCKLRMDDEPKKAVDLILDIPDQKITIDSDQVRITQVLMNLLTNSIKFTERGHIRFGILDYDISRIVFFVSDTGIGIEKSIQENMYERFRQADDSTTRLYGGVGLGLSIVKGLVELMKGEIHLESEIGKGTTFRISLPV